MHARLPGLRVARHHVRLAGVVTRGLRNTRLLRLRIAGHDIGLARRIARSLRRARLWIAGHDVGLARRVARLLRDCPLRRDNDRRLRRLLRLRGLRGFLRLVLCARLLELPWRGNTEHRRGGGALAAGNLWCRCRCGLRCRLLRLLRLWLLRLLRVRLRLWWLLRVLRVLR
jgi:hypothetical protein